MLVKIIKKTFICFDPVAVHYDGTKNFMTNFLEDSLSV